MIPRLFLDTCVVRNSIKSKEVWIYKNKTIKWGPTEQVIKVAEPIDLTPSEKLNTPEHHKAYQDALSSVKIFTLVKNYSLTGLWHFETKWEFLNLPSSLASEFSENISYLKDAKSPLYYGRTIASGFSKKDHTLKFLSSIQHPEFDLWKKAIGYTKGTKKEKNQLIDAWNLYVAEHNWSDYFITMDYKLISSVASRKHNSKLRIVTPSQFLSEFRYLEIPYKIINLIRRKTITSPDIS